MGRLYLIQLGGRVYKCKFCHSHLAQSDELISRAFQCRHGKAYLFNTVVNVSLGPQEDRLMTTGKHTVADICCNSCQQVVGWKYELAFEKSQKYKEGKFILERCLVCPILHCNFGRCGRNIYHWTFIVGKMTEGDGASFYLDSHEVDSDADNE